MESVNFETLWRRDDIARGLDHLVELVAPFSHLVATFVAVAVGALSSWLLSLWLLRKWALASSLVDLPLVQVFPWVGPTVSGIAASLGTTQFESRFGLSLGLFAFASALITVTVIPVFWSAQRDQWERDRDTASDLRQEKAAGLLEAIVEGATGLHGLPLRRQARAMGKLVPQILDRVVEMFTTDNIDNAIRAVYYRYVPSNGGKGAFECVSFSGRDQMSTKFAQDDDRTRRVFNSVLAGDDFLIDGSVVGRPYRSFISIPVYASDDRILGLLTVDSTKANFFRDLDGEALLKVAVALAFVVTLLDVKRYGRDHLFRDSLLTPRIELE